MRKKSRIFKRAYDFWSSKIKNEDYIITGIDFPDEYVRKVLLKEDLAFQIKRGLYILKDKGEGVQNLIYQSYWKIIEKLLKIYRPWAIEKESALNLYLGEESIPQALKVRTLRNVKYSLSISFGLNIQIRPDPTMHEKTIQKFKIGNAQIFLDIPEKVLLSIRKRSGINFIAFIKAIKFDKRILAVLYSTNPKPIVISELIRIAGKNGRDDLSKILKDVLEEYTIYRFKRVSIPSQR